MRSLRLLAEAIGRLARAIEDLEFASQTDTEERRMRLIPNHRQTEGMMAEVLAEILQGDRVYPLLRELVRSQLTSHEVCHQIVRRGGGATMDQLSSDPEFLKRLEAAMLDGREDAPRKDS